MAAQNIDEVLRRLETSELELQARRGYIKALEYGLHAVIASHPAPAALAELRAHVLLEVADIHGGAANRSLLFDATFHQTLADLSERI